MEWLLYDNFKTIKKQKFKETIDEFWNHEESTVAS